VHFSAEGLVSRFPYHPEAIALTQRVTRDPEFSDIESLPAAFLSDAVAPTRRGYPAMFLSTGEPGGHQPHWHWSTDVPENVNLASVERVYSFARRLLDVAAESPP
jgi:hypothetical protein